MFKIPQETGSSDCVIMNITPSRLLHNVRKKLPSHPACSFSYACSECAFYYYNGRLTQRKSLHPLYVAAFVRLSISIFLRRKSA